MARTLKLRMGLRTCLPASLRPEPKPPPRNSPQRGEHPDGQLAWPIYWLNPCGTEWTWIMTHGPVFLIGGGWTQDGFAHTYGPFVAAVTANAGSKIACVLLDEEEDERDAYYARYVAAFARIGFTGLKPVFVSPTRPLQESDLDGVDGIFIGGGLTPDYYDAIVPSSADWLPAMVTRGIPYAGFSAGAMIAAKDAIIGGWKLRRDEGNDLVICSEDVSEDLEYLDVRPGLGLIPFAVDVHASQYGTPTRMLQTVKVGLVSGGWAIDEDTAIEVSSGQATVHGLGSAYRARPTGDSLAVEILEHGDIREIW
jgi:cyanophycinase